MNFTQMQDHLRLVLLRRIERGTLSVSLLARQSGLAKSHVSTFLRQKKRLSQEALDRVLASQRLSAADLLPSPVQEVDLAGEGDSVAVALVSHAVALFEPAIRPSTTQAMVRFPAGVLQSLRWRSPTSRQAWQRFVAVRVAAEDALGMEPVLLPEAIVLLDRHYNSLWPYRPNRPNLYAVKSGSHLTLRYVDFLSRRLVLRPHNLTFPVDLIEIQEGESPGDFLAGRAAIILNET
jgi:hypothetical protein